MILKGMDLQNPCFFYECRFKPDFDVTNEALTKMPGLRRKHYFFLHAAFIPPEQAFE